MVDFSPTGLRVLREVADSGSFSAAARALGYTQSAVSRQVAALEEIAGQPLFERRPDGARLTRAGSRLLVRAHRIIHELDAAREEGAAAHRPEPVRLGAFPAAAAGLVPRALAALAADQPELTVSLREAATPALVRAVRAGTLDLAVVAQVPPYRPLDAESPSLELILLSERDLVIGVGSSHPFARRDSVEVDELAGQVWVAGPAEGGESLLGVWPGLPERPDVRYLVRDWLAKTRLVGAGLAITTIAPVSKAALQGDIHLVAVRGEPHETRRLGIARMPGVLTPGTAAVVDAVADAAEMPA